MLSGSDIPSNQVDESVLEDFLMAVKAGNERDVRALGERHPILVNVGHPYLNQALHAAVDNNQLSIARQFLEAGADVNATNSKGEYVINSAAHPF